MPSFVAGWRCEKTYQKRVSRKEWCILETKLIKKLSCSVKPGCTRRDSNIKGQLLVSGNSPFSCPPLKLIYMPSMEKLSRTTSVELRLSQPAIIGPRKQKATSRHENFSNMLFDVIFPGDPTRKSYPVSKKNKKPEKPAHIWAKFS